MPDGRCASGGHPVAPGGQPGVGDGIAPASTTTGTVANYGLGGRVSKTVNGVRTYFISLGNREIAEYDNSGSPSRRHVYDPRQDEPRAMIDAVGQRTYHLTDALGSVIGILDDSGSMVETWAYTAYGKIQGMSSATP